MSKALPKFSNPPVIEAVIGIEFEKLIAWQTPHFGLYWNTIRSDFPKYSVQPPLVPALEKFDHPGQQEVRVHVPLNGLPEIRCWFADESESSLIQVQNNRFICNWRKVLPSNEYPSFTKMRYRFEKAWDKFNHFVQQEQLGTVAATQCEVTYFNHIEFSSENSGWAGLDSIFPQWSYGSSSGFLPEPEAINMNLTYPIPDRRGRLRFSLEPVFRHADAKELIQFTVTAKIIPSTEDGRTVMEAIELGHEWAVCGFADFTSAEMHQIWQRKQ